MRRKYKIIIIILISALFTYFIYFSKREEKVNIMAIGDGIASGETSYNIDGISYNDYVKEYFTNKHLLKSYDNLYAKENYTIDDLLNDIKSNVTKSDSELTIQQTIHKSDVIILSMGEEELVKMAITGDLTKEAINEFTHKFDNLIYLLKDITEGKIVIVGFYENPYLDKSKVIILNSEVSNIAIKYDAIFINISDLLLNKDYYLSNKAFYFNYLAHREVAEMIIHSL